jgi:hypothetical protein
LTADEDRPPDQAIGEQADPQRITEGQDEEQREQQQERSEEKVGQTNSPQLSTERGPAASMEAS